MDMANTDNNKGVIITCLWARAACSKVQRIGYALPYQTRVLKSRVLKSRVLKSRVLKSRYWLVRFLLKSEIEKMQSIKLVIVGDG